MAFESDAGLVKRVIERAGHGFSETFEIGGSHFDFHTTRHHLREVEKIFHVAKQGFGITKDRIQRRAIILRKVLRSEKDTPLQELCKRSP